MPKNKPANYHRRAAELAGEFQAACKTLIEARAIRDRQPALSAWLDSWGRLQRWIDYGEE